MKTLKEYQDYLFANGYEISEGLPYGFFGDELTSVEYRNKKNKKYVLLNCYYTDELISFLEKNYEEGEEFTIDDKMMEMIEVNSATIECSIVNVPHFMDGTKPGIFLQEGGDGGVMDFSDYYQDRMDLFEKCIWIQNNELEHSKNILEQHFKNIEFFNENIKPILDGYGYYLGYSSIIDIEEKDTSSPLFEYWLPDAYDCYHICFATDCISGKLSCIVPFGNYDENGKKFEDMVNTFKKDDFTDAVDNSYNRFKKLYTTIEDIWK